MSKLSDEPKSAGAYLLNDLEDSAHYGLGRTFGGHARKQIKGYSNRHSSRRSLRRDLAAVRGCWVCRKHHRARDNHTKHEVINAINKFKSQSSSAFTAQQVDDFEWALMNDEESSDTDFSDDEDQNNSGSDSANITHTREEQQTMVDQFNNISFVHGMQTATKDIANHVKEINYTLFGTESTNEDKYLHQQSALLLCSPHSTFMV